MSTLKAAIELKSVFDQIQAAEKAGNLSPEEKKRLEEEIAASAQEIATREKEVTRLRGT